MFYSKDIFLQGHPMQIQSFTAAMPNSTDPLAVSNQEQQSLTEVCYDNGQLRFRFEQKQCPERNDWVQHGFYQEFYPNGTLAAEGFYVDGKQHGLWRDYHPNGQLAAQGYFDEGEEIGEWHFWTAQGNSE
jgi:antitoxin component YwqK of YwqJK toxin-antitoxin module